MAEVVFTLERTYKTGKDTIRDLVVELMRIRGLALDDSSLVREALDIYVGRNVSYTDAVTAVEMKRNGILQVISFDHDFDRIPGVTREEP
jgi:predicted nucleic-acid-binding protein